MPGPPHDHDHGSDHGHGHGPDHGPAHGPPHEGPPGGQFLVNDERRRDLQQIGEFLELIGSELKNGGETEISGHTIQPPANPSFVVRYERMPRGELKLYFEIEWNPHRMADPQAENSDPVREKTSMRDRSRESEDAVADKTTE